MYSFELKRVDHGDADAVQAAGHLVATSAELAAGVQGRHDERDRRDLLDRVLVDRDAAAVVDDPDSAVGLQRHLDVGRMAGQRLVDGVVDRLVDQMVQAALTGGADVHAGSLANRLEPFENLDVARVVRTIFSSAVPFAGSLAGAGACGSEVTQSVYGAIVCVPRTYPQFRAGSAAQMCR